jgi:hypothetical protein
MPARCVVQVHGVRIGENELHLTERIFGPGSLHHFSLARISHQMDEPSAGWALREAQRLSTTWFFLLTRAYPSIVRKGVALYDALLCGPSDQL